MYVYIAQATRACAARKAMYSECASSAHRTQTLESSPGIETEGEGGGQRETEFLLLYGTRFPHQLRQHVVSRLARTVLSLLS